MFDEFDLDAIEAEMEAMTAELSTEEIAAIEKEIADGLEADFNKIFGS